MKNNYINNNYPQLIEVAGTGATLGNHKHYKPLEQWNPVLEVLGSNHH